MFSSRGENMKRSSIIFKMLFTIGIFSLSAHNLSAENSDYLLIDDFSSTESRLGTIWEGFTDQVMGGRSEMSVVRVPAAEEQYIRMSGTVSLERNGGFIQIRLKLTEKGSYDASEYEGIRLKVRGKDKGYYVFLRSASTVFPWKFYKAPFEVTDQWTYVDIPWSEFTEGDYGRVKPLNTKSLKSISLTAYAREFNAELEVSEVGLYK